MRLTRRNFMKAAGGAAAFAGLALAGCASPKPSASDADAADTQTEADATPSTPVKEVPVGSTSPITKVRTTCGNCHNDCGVIVNVQDGVIISIEGDPDHPFNKGALCPKGQAFVDTVYSPDRLRSPMKRVGERGSGQWEAISWEEAYQFIGEELAKIKDTYGAQTLLYTNGAPVQNIVRNAFCEFYARYGTNNMVGAPNLCFVPRLVALKTTYGFRDEEDYNNTDLIICWAGNPFASLRPGAYMCYEKHGSASPILDAKERGVKLIVIDPIFTETAAKADQYIPIKPGTDGALANAMANVVLSEDLYDHEFVEAWCHGFDEYRECMEQYTPEWAESITGVPADTIRELARLYATTERAALHEGNSLALHSNCVQAVRSIGCLRAICGKLDKEGCNCCFPNVVGHPVPVEAGNPTGIKTTVVADAVNVNTTRYPLFLNGLPGALDAIETGDPYTPRGLMGYHTNTIMAQGDYHRNRDLLRTLDFICYTDIFMTETCEQLADIVLPDVTWAERYDYRTYPHHDGAIVAMRQPAIEPLYDCKTPYAMEYELATSMGMAEGYPWTTDEEFIQYALGPSGVSFEEYKKNPVQLVGTNEYKKYETGGLRADGEPGFDTANGKVLLVNLPFGKNGYDPLPNYVPAFGTPEGSPELAEQYPLIGTNRRTVHYVHYKYRNNPYLRENHPEPELSLNPADAAERNLKDGDAVKAVSHRGEARFTLRVSERVMPGVAWVDGGWGNPWDEPGSNMNALVDNVTRDPISQSPDISSFLMDVVKA